MSEMKSNTSEKNWRDLAAASRETDPEKLCRIIEELCGALDKARKQSQTTPLTKKSA